MKVLITGAAGFIGSHLAELLHNHDYEVVGVDNFSSYYSPSLKERNAFLLENQGIKMERLDLRVVKDLKKLPLHFNFIIHCAAHPGISAESSFEDYFTNNLEATKRLLDFAGMNPDLQHFFYISTSSVYGLEATHPETAAPRPASWYGVSKLAAEQLVLSESRQKRLKASSLRLFSVYGPRERPDKLYTKLISCAFRDEAFPIFKGSMEHRRSFTYVGDIVQGILQAVLKHEQLNGEILNLGAEEEHSTQEGIELVEALLGKQLDLKEVPSRPGDQSTTRADIQKARKLLNYRTPTSLKKGLELQIKWYMEQFL